MVRIQGGRTLYMPLEVVLSFGKPSPTKQAGHFHLTCLTVLPGSEAIISPKLALPVDAVPFVMVRLRPVLMLVRKIVTL